MYINRSEIFKKYIQMLIRKMAYNYIKYRQYMLYIIYKHINYKYNINIININICFRVVLRLVLFLRQGLSRPTWT